MAMPLGRRQRNTPRKLGDICPCRCGCGMTFVLDKVNANRRFAPDCVTRPHWARSEVVNARKKVSNKKRLAWLDEQRATRKICKVCCDLPHARPPEGCAKCGLPHGDAPAASFTPRACSPIASSLTLCIR